jgi:hypothetical protein
MEETVDYVALYQCFSLFMFKNKKILDPNMSPIERKNHICSKDCDAFQFEDIYICTVSGNIHHCTPDTCMIYVKTRESYVCPLSRLSWNLDTEMEIGAFVGQMSTQFVDLHKELELQKKPESKANDAPRLVTHRKGKRRKTTGPANEEDRIQEDAYLQDDAMSVLKQLCISKTRRQLDSGNYRTAERRVAASFRRYLHFRSASNLPLNLTTLVCIYLAENKKRYRRSHSKTPTWRRSSSPPDPSVLDKLRFYASKCVYYWHQLSPLKPPSSKLNRYRYIYHCISLLYTLVKGVSNAGGVYLEPDTQLGRLLPSIQHLHRLGYNQKVFTQHNEALLLRLAMNAQLNQ